MATTAAGVGMNIERAVKYAIAEFGKDAYCRFTDDKGLSFSDNDELNRELVGWCDIQLKTLPELFKHDVEFYGADAYLMWEVMGAKFDALGKLINADFFTPSSNESFIADERYSEVRRKTSASLKFDMERAINGDVVEMCNEYGDWSICTSKTFEMRKFPLIKLDHVSVSEFNLRMKYPKAAK
jgi:hypothetical protein